MGIRILWTGSGTRNHGMRPSVCHHSFVGKSLMANGWHHRRQEITIGSCFLLNSRLVKIAPCGILAISPKDPFSSSQVSTFLQSGWFVILGKILTDPMFCGQVQTTHPLAVAFQLVMNKNQWTSS